MNQRCADQPRHERGILNRVPKPPSTPTKVVVSPITPQRNAARQKHPCHGSPGPRPSRPCGIESACNQRRNRKSKCNGEADVAHVKHGRVHTIAGSCNRGFKSLPSDGAGSRRMKGFEVSNRKSKKPTLIEPITLTTRASISWGKWRLNSVTATVQSPRIKVHNNSEPSCDPQVAAKR